MSKNSQVISFHFTPGELEALKAQQQSGESLSQTAQRLVRQSLGLSTESTPGSTFSLSTMSTEYVDNLIQLRLAPIEERLAHVEKLPA